MAGSTQDHYRNLSGASAGITGGGSRGVTERGEQGKGASRGPAKGKSAGLPEGGSGRYRRGLAQALPKGERDFRRYQRQQAHAQCKEESADVTGRGGRRRYRKGEFRRSPTGQRRSCRRG